MGFMGTLHSAKAISIKPMIEDLFRKSVKKLLADFHETESQKFVRITLQKSTKINQIRQKFW
jgi:hypothetical protein